MPTTDFETFLRAVENLDDYEGVLGEDYLVIPPKPDYGYDATPRNALTFATMGVDGVHYAVLTTDGEIDDDSPVIHVGPMDFSEPYVVLGESFRAYLATACGVSDREMAAVFDEQRSGKDSLVPFLKSHFQHARLYNEARLRGLEQLLYRIEPKG